jgi:hypothetical protein
MKGFDEQFQDFPDYILKITKEIWEDRGIHTLHRYYAPDIVVRTPMGVSLGNQAVIGATMATLAEFPDRQLLGEDVIWSGSPEAGMLSSHRIFSTATHLGDGAYGKASGKHFRYRILADCHAKNNQIDDEWLIRDSGAIVRQLDLTPEAFARAHIQREGGPDNCPPVFTPERDIEGPYKGLGNDNEWGQRYGDIVSQLMQANMAIVKRDYDRACQVEYAGGVTGHGWDAVDRFWTPLRAALPNAVFNIEHQIGNDDAMMSPRAAIRWSLRGKHTGWGVFGAPTGADIYVMGIGHAEFGPRGIRREYVLYDELSVWKQILLHTGAA